MNYKCPQCRHTRLQELPATVIREGLVRADDLPLVLGVLGADALPRGARVRVRLGDVDDISLDLSGTVVERLDAAAAPLSVEDDTGEEEEPVAGPIAIAVDVTEGEQLDNAADNPPS